MEEQLTIPFMYCRYNLFRDAQFVQNIFDTLVKYINRVVIIFQNTSQLFYFYMKIFHIGANFEIPEQKLVI